MVWSQFSIKIIWVHFVNFILDNSNLDKISHSLTKKNQYFEQSATLFGIIKNKKKKRKTEKNCKANPLSQTLVYRSSIYYSKIYQKGNSKLKKQ